MNCAKNQELRKVGDEADGLEVRGGCCEGNICPEDFVWVAPQVDVFLLGPRLDAVGLCRLQRLVDYDREENAREGVALAVSSAALAEVLESGLGLGGAHVVFFLLVSNFHYLPINMPPNGGWTGWGK